MKLKQLFAAGAIIAGIAMTAYAASRVVYSQALVNETALAYSKTYPLDLGNSILPWSNIEQLSMQAVYSTATLTASTFTDGTASTAAITVGASFASLHGARGKDTIFVASNTSVALANSYFTLNGNQFMKDDLWSAAALSSNTALNMMNAINNYGSTNGTFIASLSGSTVTITCIASGTFCNNYTLATSTPAAIRISSTSTTASNKFTGGVNQGFIVIGGNILTEGVDWFATGSAATTAKSISDAIQANPTLANVINSTWSAAGVVTATATVHGVLRNYGVMVSSPAILTVTNKGFYGGTSTLVSTTTGRIELASTNLTTALPVLFTKTAGTPPGSLVANTTYYVIKVDSNHIQLAATSTGAVAGSNVAIATQTATGGGSFTLTPLAFTGSAAFKWQVSNDNSNWIDMSVSSVTITSTTTAISSAWDFGTVNYRYIRLNETGPTTGGISLVVTGQGKTQ